MIPVNGYKLGRRRKAMAATRDDAFYAMSCVTPVGSNHIKDMSQVVIAKLCHVRERNPWPAVLAMYAPVHIGAERSAIQYGDDFTVIYKASLFLQDQVNGLVCRTSLFPTARDGHISE